MATTRERSGRPTQFHGVPLEERAFDSSGNRLPWALEYPDDHPDARQQKRQPEEKGPFGKPTRRKGSSRLTRTQTPAKKENPTLDGFDAALRYDAERESRQASPERKRQADGNTTITLHKEPCQVMLFGFPSESSWSAIQFYESVSGGMICEDYAREPPLERRRYHGNLGHSDYIHPRPLTPAEQKLVCKFAGGHCWIKVTFDSREAAERAVYSSPHVITGHLVHAQLYHGQAPERDEPLLAREQGGRTAQTLGPSFSTTGLLTSPRRKPSATLSRSFSAAQTADPGLVGTQAESETLSSSTASSGTVTGIEYPNIGQHLSSTVAGRSQSPAKPTTFTHFPQTPRTVLIPATEAILPQPSWLMVRWKQITQLVGFPKEIIGTTVPRQENGEFDSKTATLYWKFFYWVDQTLGSDWCGLKEA